MTYLNKTSRGHWYDRVNFRNKLHRTKSQYTLEACGRVDDLGVIAERKSRSDNDLRHRHTGVVSVNLCDHEYGVFMLDLCRNTMYDNSNKCQRWLAGVCASLPLEEDLSEKTLPHTSGSAELRVDNSFQSNHNKLHTEKFSSCATRTSDTPSSLTRKISCIQKNKSRPLEQKKRMLNIPEVIGINSSPEVVDDLKEIILEGNCDELEVMRDMENSLTGTIKASAER